MRGKRWLSTAEKVKFIRRLEAGESAARLAREAGVACQSVYNWRSAYLAFGAAGLNRKRGPKAGRVAATSSSSPDASAAATRPADESERAQARIAELERLVGRQQADLDFFREALRSWDEKRRVSGALISSPSLKK
jgi:transposase